MRFQYGKLGNGPVHISHFWRKHKESTRGEVIQACWHPHRLEILGLYSDGVLFKWQPYIDESEERFTRASKLAITKDGNLFATGDVWGMVQVYTTSDFGLLYQLSSEDTILGLAFSPDLHRFYDIRGHYGGAWEPNALVKYAEQRGRDFDSRSEIDGFIQASRTFENPFRRFNSITVVASSPVGRFYCFGTDKGELHLRDIQQGKRRKVYTSKAFWSIQQISWSNDGRFLCFSDLVNKIYIISIPLKISDSIHLAEKAEIPIKSSIGGLIRQLLFRPASSQLLVCSSTKLCVISLESHSLLYSSEFHGATCKWITHPHDESLIMSIGLDAIHLLDWTLTERQKYDFESPLDERMLSKLNSCHSRYRVDRILVTQDRRHLLAQISPSDHSRDRVFLMFESSWFNVLSTEANEEACHATGSKLLRPLMLPQELSSQVIHALCFLSHDNLIFISQKFWVCSWRLPTSTSSTSTSLLNSGEIPETFKPTSLDHHCGKDIRRNADSNAKPLFPLPGDWIHRDSMSLCSIWPKEGSLLFPKNEELAVVKCAALT